MARVSRKSLDVSTALTHLWLNSNKGTKRDMAISLIPFDRLDFRTLGYPQNGAPFSPPNFGGRIPILSRSFSSEKQVEVLPGNRRAMGHRVEQRLPADGILEALVLPGTDVPSTGSCVSKLSRRARTS